MAMNYNRTAHEPKSRIKKASNQFAALALWNYLLAFFPMTVYMNKWSLEQHTIERDIIGENEWVEGHY